MFVACSLELKGLRSEWRVEKEKKEECSRALYRDKAIQRGRKRGGHEAFIRSDSLRPLV